MPVPTIDRARRVTITRAVAVLAGLVALVFAVGPVKHNLLRVAWFPIAWVLRWTGSRYGTGDAFARSGRPWRRR